MTDSTKPEITPSEIKQKCTEWEQNHSTIDSENFLLCAVDIIKHYGLHGDVIGTVMQTVIETGNIKRCSCCGVVPAYEKDINGELIQLCNNCQCLVLYQQLGPGEGYI